MDHLQIGTYRFRNLSDYEAGKRDTVKIQKLRQETDFDSFLSVEKLYQRISGGEISFESIIGRDFDDEVYELYQQLKQQPVKTDRKKTSNRSLNRTTGVKKGKNARDKAEISLDDFDEEMQQQIKAELKRRDKIRRIILISSATVFFVCMAYLAVYHFMTLRTQKEVEELAKLREEMQTAPPVMIEEEDTDSENSIVISTENPYNEPPQVLPLYEELYIQNKSLIGWVKIADTIIDYPVMQSQNNEYYLDHNFNQEYDKNGCIFLDAACDIYPRNDNLILYGHHMKSGKMFGSLWKFESEDFYKKHSRIEFDTIYETGVYEIMYVFRDKVYSEADVNFKYYEFLDAYSEEEFQSNMAAMAAMSYYDTGVTAEYGDQLLTLSTCDYAQNNGRFVVVAKKISK